MKRAIIVTIVFLCCCIISCHSVKKSNYPNNPLWSHTNGEPIDSFTHYFPDSIRTDSFVRATGIDSISQKEFSELLFAAKEPVLYNYYTGHDIYRLVLRRNLPLILTLNRDSNKVWLILKLLNTDPSMPPLKKTIVFAPPNAKAKTRKKISEEPPRIDTISDSLFALYNRPYRVLFVKRVELSLKEWNEFKRLTEINDYWDIISYDTMTDGVKSGRFCCGNPFSIERQINDNYHFIDRDICADRKLYNESIDYLIKLCEPDWKKDAGVWELL